MIEKVKRMYHNFIVGLNGMSYKKIVKDLVVVTDRLDSYAVRQGELEVECENTIKRYQAKVIELDVKGKAHRNELFRAARVAQKIRNLLEVE